jgi:D-alanyl-D-alanine endopeptidase (penicillin-binding protein 7)
VFPEASYLAKMARTRIRILAAATIIVLALPVAGAAAAAAHHDPQLRSGSLLVIDADSSRVLLARNAAQPVAIASITKLMTALVVLEGGQALDESLGISAEDVVRTQRIASRLAPGASLTRAELLHLALMSSDNRAAQALARHYPGGVNAFVVAMNRKAQALGMRHARFEDPTGIAAGNVASPEDLVRLVNAAAAHPVIRRYSTDPAHAVRVGRQELEFRNTNTLAHDPGWDLIVQKTGFTQEAGRCLVLKARVDGRTLLMVLLDSFGKYTRVADARRVRKWLAAQAPVMAAPAVMAATAG